MSDLNQNDLPELESQNYFFVCLFFPRCAYCNGGTKPFYISPRDRNLRMKFLHVPPGSQLALSVPKVSQESTA